MNLVGVSVFVDLIWFGFSLVDKMGEQVEVARELVLGMLPDLTEKDLGEVAVGLSLQIKEPKGKISKKSVLLNTLRRYITSEEVENQEDEGLEMLGSLHTDMEARLEEKKKSSEVVEKEETTPIKSWLENDLEEKLAAIKLQVKTDVEAEENWGGLGTSSTTREALNELKMKENWNRLNEEQLRIKTQMEVEEKQLQEMLKKKSLEKKRTLTEGLGRSIGMDIHKFKIREFKINGTIGGENEMEYSSLMYQVKEGRTLGYSEKEIQLGIVKMVKDKTLKKFFEINTDMSEDDFYGMIRNHYDVKDANTLLEEMVTSVQEPTENIVRFVMRMMNARDTIMDVTKCEDCPLGESRIQKQFVRSVLVGLRKATNRIELQAIFERTDLRTELEILKAVKEIMKKDDENAKKMGKKAEVMAMDMEVDLKGLASRRKEDEVVKAALLEQVTSLTTQVQGLMAAMNLLKEEMQEIKRSCMVNNQNYGNQNQNQKNNNNFKFLKCKECDKNKKFCTHCSLCGEGGHKRKDCEKNE